MLVSPSINPDPAGFGVYIHWPFCASKCPYCDFNSHVRLAGIDEARFLAAFRREIAETAAAVGKRATGSVFFGGGTPSLMRASTVGAILEEITRHWPIEPGAEITLEANPSSVESERFKGYRSAGVNRVSLGVQALQDADLKALGRLHSTAEALTAIDTARTVFDRFSFDLIYARPGQTAAAWEDELRRALRLARGHLSLYQLTIEPGTPFAALHAAGRLRLPAPELADDLYQLTEDVLAAAGLSAYEISNYAAAGDESRHNLLYWRYGEYAGIGPGAHGRLILSDRRHLTSTERAPEDWLARVETVGHGRTEFSALTGNEQADEALLMALRLAEGIDLTRLAALGGRLPRADAIGELEDQGLLERIDEQRLRATRRGRLVLDTVVLRLSAAMEPVPAEAGSPAGYPRK